MIIRRGKRADRPRLRSLIASFSPLDAELAERDLRGETYVAEEKEKILGFTGIIPDQLSPRVCWLSWTYFDPEYRNGPHGPGDPIGAVKLWGCLLRHVEEIVARRGKVLFITTSSHPAYVHAIHFYQRHGYRIAGTLPDFYGPQIDLIAFCRQPSTPSDVMLHGIDESDEKIRQLQLTVDAFAGIFREFDVGGPGMTPEECTESLRSCLDDARKFRALKIAPVFSRVLG